MTSEAQSLQTKGHGSKGQVAAECRGDGVMERRFLCHRVCPGMGAGIQKAEQGRKANHHRRRVMNACACG